MGIIKYYNNDSGNTSARVFDFNFPIEKAQEIIDEQDGVDDDVEGSAELYTFGHVEPYYDEDKKQFVIDWDHEGDFMPSKQHLDYF